MTENEDQTREERVFYRKVLDNMLRMAAIAMKESPEARSIAIIVDWEEGIKDVPSHAWVDASGKTPNEPQTIVGGMRATMEMLDAQWNLGLHAVSSLQTVTNQLQQEKEELHGQTEKGKRKNPLTWARKLETILEVLNISRWDYLLIGDGSGNLWDYGCAFAALMIENDSDWRDVFFGGFNCGTNNYAELNAYCNPLDWLMEQKRSVTRRSSDGACRVHILSDSEWVVKSGNKEWPRKAHASTWAKFEAYQRHAILLKFHWIPGHEGIPANEFVDSVAGEVNKLLKGYDFSTALEGIQQSGIDHLYPKSAE